MPNAQCPGLCVQSPCWRSDRWFPTLCTGQLYDFFKHLKSIVGFSLLTLSMCVAGEDTRLELTSTQVEYSVDLGVFRANETIVKRLTFVNNSLSPLTPSGVKASCGCIVAKVPAKAISPAGTISFDVHLRSGAGIFQKTLGISFRELQEPLVVKFSGEAKNLFTIAPSAVHLSPKKTSQEIVLTSVFVDPLSNVKCRSLGNLVKVEVKNSREDSLRLLVSCADSEDRFWRSVNSSIETIELSFPDDRKLQVDIYVNSLVGVSVFPRVVSLNDRSKTDQVTVYWHENTSPPKFLRFILSGAVIAEGTLSSKSHSSTLARYAIKPKSDIATKLGCHEALIEESDNEEVWKDLSFVHVSFE